MVVAAAVTGAVTTVIVVVVAAVISNINNNVVVLVIIQRISMVTRGGIWKKGDVLRGTIDHLDRIAIRMYLIRIGIVLEDKKNERY